MNLLVQEVFDTIQGEGTFTGTPATFVRLQGCDVGCAFCDTKHTWSTADGEVPWSGKRSSPVRLVAMDWARAPLDELVAEVVRRVPRHVVITGGEPAAQDLGPLCRALLEAGKTVQIETSGTYPLDVPSSVWVTVSPKIQKPGKRAVLLEVVRRADEIKHPVGRERDVEELTELFRELGIRDGDPHPPVYLQPLSQSEVATALCVREATARGWRVSVQVHKYIGLP